MTSPLERSCRRSPYHQSGNPGGSFAWCSFVDCFIHENGNCSVAVTVRRRARHSAAGAEPMCALPRRQSWLRGEGTPRGKKVLAEPFGLVRSLAEEKPSRGLERSLAEEKPSRGLPGLESLVLGGARQAWRAWSLARLARLGEPDPWRGSPSLESLVLGEIFWRV